jgi:hypothetical protein
MATSGTTTFNLNIDDVITEGYERCGLVSNSGYDMRSARRSLDLLFAEWGNRGIHLWKTELNEIALVSGQANYTVDSDVNDVLEAYVSSTAAAGNNINTQGLAYYIAMKKAPALVQQSKLIYEDELKRALDEDGQRTSTYITPQSFYPNGV